MGKLAVLMSMCVLASGMALAQSGAETPPSDYGIGNSSLSPYTNDSSVGNSPSYSPDQNQVMTNTTGSTTGDRYPNPAFAGYPAAASASSALAQGDVGATGETSATAGERLPSAAAQSAQPAAQSAKKTRPQRRVQARKRQTKRGKQTVSVPLTPEEGPSNTEAPGPATGVRAKKVPQGGMGNYSGTSTKSSGPGYGGPGREF